MNFSPCGYFVLILMEAVEQVSEGGIVLHTPEVNKREQKGHYRGIVAAFGPIVYSGLDAIPDGPESTAESRAKAWGVSVGDTVEFTRYDGREIKIPDSADHYRLVKDFDILGRVTP